MKKIFSLFIPEPYPTTGERRDWIIDKRNLNDVFSQLALTMSLNRAEMTSHGFTKEEALASPNGEDLARKSLYYGTTLGMIESMLIIK